MTALPSLPTAPPAPPPALNGLASESVASGPGSGTASGASQHSPAGAVQFLESLCAAANEAGPAPGWQPGAGSRSGAFEAPQSPVSSVEAIPSSRPTARPGQKAERPAPALRDAPAAPPLLSIDTGAVWRQVAFAPPAASPDSPATPLPDPSPRVAATDTTAGPASSLETADLPTLPPAVMRAGAPAVTPSVAMALSPLPIGEPTAQPGETAIDPSVKTTPEAPAPQAETAPTVTADPAPALPTATPDVDLRSLPVLQGLMRAGGVVRTSAPGPTSLEPQPQARAAHPWEPGQTPAPAAESIAGVEQARQSVPTSVPWQPAASVRARVQAVAVPIEGAAFPGSSSSSPIAAPEIATATATAPETGQHAGMDNVTAPVPTPPVPAAPGSLIASQPRTVRSQGPSTTTAAASGAEASVSSTDLPDAVQGSYTSQPVQTFDESSVTAAPLLQTVADAAEPLPGQTISRPTPAAAPAATAESSGGPTYPIVFRAAASADAFPQPPADPSRGRPPSSSALRAVPAKRSVANGSHAVTAFDSASSLAATAGSGIAAPAAVAPLPDAAGAILDKSPRAAQTPSPTALPAHSSRGAEAAATGLDGAARTGGRRVPGDTDAAETNARPATAEGGPDVAFQARLVPIDTAELGDAQPPADVPRPPATRAFGHTAAAPLPDATASPSGAEAVTPVQAAAGVQMDNREGRKAPIATAAFSGATQDTADRARKPEVRAEAALPAGAAPVQASPDPRQSDSAEAAPPAQQTPRPAPPAEPKPAPAPRASDIKLDMANGDRRVEVRLTDRGGEIHLAVRTPDSHLSGALRDNLPALASRLEQSGFRTEAWHPVTSAGDGRRDLPRFSEGATADSNGQPGQGSGKQGDPQPRKPKIPDEPTDRNQKGNEFSWLMSSLD